MPLVHPFIVSYKINANFQWATVFEMNFIQFIVNIDSLKFFNEIDILFFDELLKNIERVKNQKYIRYLFLLVLKKVSCILFVID